MKNRFSFEKNERVASQKLIDELFTGGNSQSVAAFPLRAVYMVQQRQADEPPAKLLISVAKRRLHHAVDRNRTKRQLREAYRLNKRILQPAEGGLNIAFLWNSNELLPTPRVTEKMKTLLSKINETVADTPSGL